MYKAAIVSERELERLTAIRDIVRLGHVRRIERQRIDLDHGSIPAGRGDLHVHCAARGLTQAPSRPIFGDECITLQPVRPGLIPFNAALVGFVEATHDDVAVKNRLCPPNRLPDAPADWVRGTLIGLNADYLWSKDAAVSAWLERSRLNLARGVRRRMGEPGVQASAKRYADNVRAALVNLQKWSAG
jgi:hypothetical protein